MIVSQGFGNGAIATLGYGATGCAVDASDISYDVAARTKAFKVIERVADFTVAVRITAFKAAARAVDFITKVRTTAFKIMQR